MLEEGITPNALEFGCVGSVVVRANGGEDRGAQGNLGGASTNTITQAIVFEIEGSEIKSSATDMLLGLIGERCRLIETGLHRIWQPKDPTV